VHLGDYDDETPEDPYRHPDMPSGAHVGNPAVSNLLPGVPLPVARAWHPVVGQAREVPVVTNLVLAWDDGLPDILASHPDGWPFQPVPIAPPAKVPSYLPDSRAKSKRAKREPRCFV